MRAEWLHLFKIDVTHDAATPFFFEAIDADVDDDSSLFNHLFADETGFSHSGDKDIG